MRSAKKQAERQVHIDALVAAAPVPTSEQLDELARLLYPSSYRDPAPHVPTEADQRSAKIGAAREYLASAKAAVESVALINSVVEAAGLLQSELAAVLGVTEGRVSQVLNGDGNVRVSTLARFLRAAGYELDVTAAPIVKP